MNTFNFKSIDSRFSGKTLKWFSTDSKETFAYNLKHNRDQLEKNECLDLSIEYKFNSNGFRCDEFDDSPSFMALGCSHTFGLGLSEKFTWPFIVSKELGLKNQNISMGGGSNDSCFRFAFQYIPLLNPKIVCLLAPDEYRFELIENDEKIHRYLPEFEDNHTDFYQKWITGRSNAYFNFQKNFMAIENICNKKEIKFLWLSWRDLKKIDLARDLRHRGKISNLVLSDMILRKINKI
jgi:hypothetical protein